MDVVLGGTGIASISALDANVTLNDGSPAINWIQAPTPNIYAKERGHKMYELSDHLGNVQATISDRKEPYAYDEGSSVQTYLPVLLSRSEVYPFGWGLPGRSFNASEYRYGFNTQEKVDEVKGSGNHYTAEFWEYDPRAVQRWNMDPKAHPGFSPYDIMRGNPILFSDHAGDSVSSSGEYEAYGLYGDAEDLVLSDYRDNSNLVIEGGGHLDLDDAQWLRGKAASVAASSLKSSTLSRANSTGNTGRALSNTAKAYDLVTDNPANTAASFLMRGVKGGGAAVTGLALVGEHHADNIMHNVQQSVMLEKAVGNYYSALDATQSYAPIVVVYTSERLFQDGQVQTVHGIERIVDPHHNSDTAKHFEGSGVRYAYLGVQNSRNNISIIAGYENFTVDN